MKKILLLILAFALIVTACGTKKVESKYHFGYDLEFAKNEFNIPNFEIVLENERAIRFGNENITITFSLMKDSKYIDAIYVCSLSKEEALECLEKVDKFMDIYTDDCGGIDYLKELNDLGAETLEDIQFGYIPDYDGKNCMLEIIKYEH